MGFFRGTDLFILHSLHSLPESNRKEREENEAINVRYKRKKYKIFHETSNVKGQQQPRGNKTIYTYQYTKICHGK